MNHAKRAVVLAITGIILLPFAVVGCLVGTTAIVSGGKTEPNKCSPNSFVAVGPAAVTIHNVSDLTGQQLGNIRIILGVAVKRRLSARDQLITLSTAGQESGYVNVTYGDRDSLGLFQQRASWGSAAERLNPVISTNKFIDALEDVTDRNSMSVLDVALAVQRPSRAAYLSPDNYFPDWVKVAQAILGGAAPSGGTGPTPTSTPDDQVQPKDLKAVLQKVAASNDGGTTSIVVSTLDGTVSASVQGDRQMATRNTYKVFVAATVARDVDQGKFSWPSVQADMEAMLLKSDNEAAQRLRDKVGVARVNALLQEMGLSSNTHLASGSSNANSQSTANDFVSFLTKLYKGMVPGLDDTGKNRVLDLMKRNEHRKGIPAGVPDDVEVANKAGWAGGSSDPATNDVGIVYAARKPYVIVVLMHNAESADNYGANDWAFVGKVSRAVYDAVIPVDSSQMGGSSASCSTDTNVSTTEGIAGKVTVQPGADAPGRPTTKVTLDFIAKVAGIAGREIIITTGTDHDKFTVNGNVSDHYSGHAGDIGSAANGFPIDGEGGDIIAAACLQAAGIPEKRAKAMAAAGGLWTIDHGGLRIQCIWKTDEGGNHHDHVHIGAKPNGSATTAQVRDPHIAMASNGRDAARPAGFAPPANSEGHGL